MCGIFFELADNLDTTSLNQNLLDRVTCRGPDAQGTCSRSAFNQQLRFTSSVLHLRGVNVTLQPISESHGNVLCWNGEAWSGLDIGEQENDTQALFQALSKNPAQIPRIMEKIRGPYAFVFYQADEGKLWYGRDILGRRSLLLNQGLNSFMLCSVSPKDKASWEEVTTLGLRCYDLASQKTILYKWTSGVIKSDELQKSYTDVNPALPAQISASQKADRCFYEEAVTNFRRILSEAVIIRTSTIPPGNTNAPTDSRIAVMYSGGVDCAVIARLLHEVLDLSEPLDLLNISFENPRTVANAKKLDSSYSEIYSTPDRLNGLQGFTELMSTCPGRRWRFVEIDVPYSAAQAAKSDVLDLMYPNDSIMDYSIALAFYFCGKGVGTLCEPGCERVPNYKTPAKVYFSGLGADEQLGGYSRHAAAYRNNGYRSLIAELQLDLDRIPSRNLGRDDRILSNFAREVRWPFLDENVITFLSDLRIDQKMNFDIEGGDKWILRELGRRLGIPKAASEKKRAIQFGSRSARMEIESGKSDRVKGHQKQQ